MTTTLSESHLPGLTRVHRGKVRDVYALPDGHLLMVASDRLSAFDVILPDPIPGKGEILTQMSNFWFALTQGICPNHLTGIDPVSVLPPGVDADLYRRRSVVAKRLKPVPVEAIARGYLIGSGWKDYQATGAVCGIALPAGLKMAQKLPQPIFTPATKADIGEHDENISFEQSQAHCAKVLAEALYGTGKNGAELAAQARSVAAGAIVLQCVDQAQLAVAQVVGAQERGSGNDHRAELHCGKDRFPQLDLVAQHHDHPVAEQLDKGQVMADKKKGQLVFFF